jgi:hypothetical protein
LKEIPTIHPNPVGSFEVQENGGVKWEHEAFIICRTSREKKWMTQERFPSPLDFSLENFLEDEVVLSARE